MTNPPGQGPYDENPQDRNPDEQGPGGHEPRQPEAYQPNPYQPNAQQPEAYPPNPYPPNPYPQSDPYQPNPYQQGGYAPGAYAQPYGAQGMSQPHPQGVTVLVLGIVGLAVCFIAGIVALVIGSKALKEIDANPAAYNNRQQVSIGRILAIVGIVWQVLVLGIYSALALTLVMSNS